MLDFGAGIFNAQSQTTMVIVGKKSRSEIAAFEVQTDAGIVHGLY